MATRHQKESKERSRDFVRNLKIGLILILTEGWKGVGSDGKWWSCMTPKPFRAARESLTNS